MIQGQPTPNSQLPTSQLSRHSQPPTRKHTSALTVEFFFPAARHFDPVQFLFHLMKRIIADLFARTHGENRLARRLKGSAVNVAVGESSGFPFFRIGIDRIPGAR